MSTFETCINLQRKKIFNKLMKARSVEFEKVSKWTIRCLQQSIIVRSNEII